MSIVNSSSSSSSNEYEVETVSVIDCVNFNENSARNYKEVPLDQVFPLNYVVLSTSRYEVLFKNWRKIYFDLDKIENKPENKDIAVRFITAWKKWLANYTKRPELENMKYVITTNTNSATHPGLSFHIICYEYSMQATELKNSIIMFCNGTEEGKEFKEIVDISVYSHKRLFKVPNYTGIPLGDPENYHHMDPTDNNIEHYIIQSTGKCQQINIHIKVPKNIRAAAKKQIISPLNGEFYAKLATTMEELKQVFVEKRTKSYSFKHLEYELNMLIQSPLISERAKNKLTSYQPLTNENLPMVEHLVKLIKEKFNIIIPEPTTEL